MFVVIYKFNVKENRNTEFINAWNGLTQLIYKHEGSLGSRLHKKNEEVYLAYAQWPDKNTRKNSGNNLPESANEIRKTMRESCTEIKTLYELNCIDDLLKSKPNNSVT